MYDAWYNDFLPSAQQSSRREPAVAAHRRTVSLLQQPNEDHTDAHLPEDASQHPFQPLYESSNHPPVASVAPRPSSFANLEDLSAPFDHDNAQDAATFPKGKQRRKRPRRRSDIEEQEHVEPEEWSAALDDQLLDASNDIYQQYLDQLSSSRRHLDSLADDTASNLDLMSTLSTSFKAVEAQASTFQDRCESLVAEQRRMTALADHVGHNLQYYNYLDPITRRLNAPGVGHFVRGDDFSQMLSQLDECLEYMQAHPEQREASTYGSRYRLLLTRGLTLIRVYFTNTLRETSADVSKRIADRQLNDTTMPALLYAKFRVAAGDLKKLGNEIQKRAAPPPDSEPGAQGEYQSLVNELHQSYSAARGRLIIPLARKKMAEIDMAPSSSKDLVSFARSSISYVRGICLDEYELWHEWFDGDDGLYEFLEALCDPLYDYLRPRTIRETQLPKLCEMCSLLQVRYMEEPDDESEPPEDDQLDFSVIIRPALEDAQTRLVFLALAVLRDDIERFKAKPSDLNYPARNRNVPLSGTKSKAPALSGRKASLNGTDQLAPKAPTIVEEDGADAVELKWKYESSSSFQGWYPTLKKAIWLLSKIYRLVNSTVFDDLAHQIVHQTTLSLQQASTQVKSRASPVDGQLFLLKQLLTLKQQIVAFDIEFVTPEIGFDFSSMTNTFWELRERGGLFNPRNLMRLVGSSLVPNVVENMLDAKAELDARLRTVINDFTNGYASKMTNGVSPAAADKKNFDAATAVKAVRESVEKEAPTMRAKLDEYLEDLRTKDTLAGAVQDQVQTNYEGFYNRHMSQTGAKTNGSWKKGKSRDDGVWDPDTFADWASTIFGLGNGMWDDEEGKANGGSSSPALSTTGSSV